MLRNLSILISGIVLASLILPNPAFTQANTQINPEYTVSSNIKEVTVGDVVPDIEIRNIINFRANTLKLSSLRGTWIIIDFWRKACSSCITALPKLDSLQKLHVDKLQVITVSDLTSKQEADQLLSRYTKTKNLNLPIVLKDKILAKYFPHKYVSHVVWIDPTGKVKAITGTEYVTARNVQAIFSESKINWPIKKDVFDFDYQKPFLEFSQDKNNTNDGLPFLYYSAFSGNMEGINAVDRASVDSIRNTITMNYFNKTLIQLTHGSLQGHGSGFIESKHLILQVRDPHRYIFKKSESFYAEWAKDNTFCYSVTLPLNLSKEDTQEFIRNDLTRWLKLMGITIRKERMLVNCLLLVRTNNEDSLFVARGGKYINNLSEPVSVKKLYNASISTFIRHLNRETENILWVIDETGLPNNLKVDLEFEIDSFENIPALRKSLQQYGLDLREAKRELDIYIIKEAVFRP